MGNGVRLRGVGPVQRRRQDEVDALYLQGAGIEEVDAALLEAGRRGGPAGVPSFGQDVRKGRRNEIDYLNGYVSDMGRKHGVPTPFNDKIVEIVHDLGIDFKGDVKHIQPLVEMLP